MDVIGDPLALAWLTGAAVLAGLVRGFAGFGTALVFVPLAAIHLPPVWVIVVLTVMDLIGPLPNLPRAWRDGRPRDVAVLGAFAALGLAPGLWVLTRMDGDAFRWVAAGLCLATLAVLASGWRWTGRMTPAVLGGTGIASGLLGGLSGLVGPPVIVMHMAAPLPAAVIRANVTMFLVLWDAMLGAVLLATGRLEAAPLIVGAALILPYTAANVIGARLFHPGREKAWRRLAYGLIAGAALAALPIWS